MLCIFRFHAIISCLPEQCHILPQFINHIHFISSPILVILNLSLESKVLFYWTLSIHALYFCTLNISEKIQFKLSSQKVFFLTKNAPVTAMMVHRPRVHIKLSNIAASLLIYNLLYILACNWELHFYFQILDNVNSFAIKVGVMHLCGSQIYMLEALISKYNNEDIGEIQNNALYFTEKFPLK